MYDEIDKLGVEAMKFGKTNTVCPVCGERACKLRDTLIPHADELQALVDWGRKRARDIFLVRSKTRNS